MNSIEPHIDRSATGPRIARHQSQLPHPGIRESLRIVLKIIYPLPILVYPPLPVACSLFLLSDLPYVDVTHPGIGQQHEEHNPYERENARKYDAPNGAPI